MTDDLTCETAGCTRSVPNRERCTPCEIAFEDGQNNDDGSGVRGREEVEEKLEEMRAEKNELIEEYKDISSEYPAVNLAKFGEYVASANKYEACKWFLGARDSL